MKTKKVSFSKSVQEFKAAENERLEAKRRREAKRLRAEKRVESAIKKQLDRLLKEALTNLRKMIAADKAFGAYLASVVKDRAVLFDDSCGVCGFPAPTLRWEKGSASMLVAGQTFQVLVGQEDDCDSHIAVLGLYEEGERTAHKEPVRQYADGESESRTKTVLALAFLRGGALAIPGPKQIADCRLVIVNETFTDLCLRRYSKLGNVPLDNGFSETLQTLCDPAKAHKFFLKKFGLPRETA